MLYLAIEFLDLHIIYLVSKLHLFLLRNDLGLDKLGAKYVRINVKGGTGHEYTPTGLDNVYHTKC